MGAEGCDLPAAHPSGAQFLCLGGERNGTLFVYPMPAGPGRQLFALPRGERFRYARWSSSGDRIYGITGAGDLVTLDPASGALLRQEALPAPAAGGSHILAAALSGDAKVAAYSTVRFASDLYLVTGIR